MVGIDAGASFGAGISFAVGPGSLFLEGRYNLGLVKVYDKDESRNNSSSGSNKKLFEGLYPDNAMTNGVINLSIGYLIPINK